MYPDSNAKYACAALLSRKLGISSACLIYTLRPGDVRYMCMPFWVEYLRQRVFGDAVTHPSKSIRAIAVPVFSHVCLSCHSALLVGAVLSFTPVL